jgi:uncharacterized protein (TIGR03382 family)
MRTSIAVSLGLIGVAAHAEDQSELGGHGLLPSTVLFVDIVDPAVESIAFDGIIPLPPPGGGTAIPQVRAFEPDGDLIGLFDAGDIIPATDGPGAYELELVGVGDVDGQNGAEPLSEWSVEVVGSTTTGGRVWSRRWALNGGGFGTDNGLDGSFYAVVDGGAPGAEGLIELRMAGLTGFVYAVLANDEGVSGANARSREEGFGPISDRSKLYLRPPEIVVPDVRTPTLTDVEWLPPTCGGIAAGIVEATLSFESDVSGSWHLVCDVDGDGVHDPTGADDLHLFGEAGIGSNTVALDGAGPDGVAVAAGTHSCELWLAVGEFHYLAQDIETSYPGFRMFAVDDALVRTGRPMYWDDRFVQADAVVMQNGSIPLGASGADGRFSGADADAPDADVNARSWGDFTTDTKGNNNVLDTWTWLDRAVSEPFDIVVLDPTLDTDGEGLVDAAETCVYGTNPTLPDTDGDTLDDAAEALDLPSDPLLADSDGDTLDDAFEIPNPAAPVDTDSDGDPDVIDDDDDDDGVPTAVEGTVDTDGDGVPDYQDRDDDDDGVSTAVEAPGDTDGDGLTDRLDPDDDGDGIPTLDEDRDGNGNALGDDTDGDGLPDFLDPDDDGDGLPTIEELPGDSDGDGLIDVLDPDDDNDTVPSGADGLQDTDGDGTINYLDPDDDDDGIPTADEDVNGDGDPTNDDADQDGIPNFLEDDDDGDGLPTELEDPDGNGVPDDDSDADAIPDYLDPDDDDDGIPTLDEDPDGDGDPRNDDTDGDGLPNYLDPDDDDDGLPTDVEGDGDADGDGIPDALETDADADGIPDSIEGTVDSDGDGLRDFQDPDDDDDTVPTLEEGTVDSDGDGLSDHLDPDDDNDTVPTADELPGDTDGDGLDDRVDDDDDGDGIPTVDEQWTESDVDGDGLANWVDEDADGDGLHDAEEGTTDLDGDGIPAFLDPDGALVTFYRGSGFGCSAVGSGGTLGWSLVVLGLLGLRRRR